MLVNILGTDYKIQERSKADDPVLRYGLSGYCDYTSRTIVIDDFAPNKSSPRECDDLQVIRRETLRHEILHAFAHESGMGYESKWAQDEECIDYYAKQIEKMIVVFTQAGALSKDAIDAVAMKKLESPDTELCTSKQKEVPA